MQLTLFGPSPRTSQDGSAHTTTPSDVSWLRLSEQMMPCVRHSNEDGGQVRVWLPGHGYGRLGGFSTLNFWDLYTLVP